MKNHIFLFLSLLYGVGPLPAQQNNILRGKILLLSSGKKPAVGVQIEGAITRQEKANIVYTTIKGTYQLVFQNARDGYPVDLKIGEQDANGQLLELVNDKEVEVCKIPAKILGIANSKI